MVGRAVKALVNEKQIAKLVNIWQLGPGGGSPRSASFS